MESERHPAVLALDQGGHSSRAMLFDDRGEAIARSRHEVGESRPGPGRVEQDPEELVASICAAVNEVTADRELPGPLPVGLATQRSSIVCWDRKSGAPLSPVLSWQDRRAAGAVDALAARADEVHRRTGLRLSPHYGASKLRWCLDELPAVAAALRAGTLRAGPLASFLTCRLAAGRPHLVDPANAGRTLLYSLDDADWDPVLLEAFGVPASILPRPVATRHDFGALSEASARLELRVVNGDQSAAIFGAGAPDERTAYLNLGTGAFLQLPRRERPTPAPGILASVTFEDEEGERLYVLEGTVNGAGSALRNVAEEEGIEEYVRGLSAWLDRPLSPPIFLNGVSGLGSPYWEASFPTRFEGSGGAWEKLVAVVESIVFLVRINLDRFGPPAQGLRRILVTGGLGGYDGLCRRLAALTRLPVERSGQFEATARGVAYLAAGRPDDWIEPPPAARFEPRPDAALVERFARFRELLERELGRIGPSPTDG